MSMSLEIPFSVTKREMVPLLIVNARLRRAHKQKTARLHGTKAPPRLIPATWDFAYERAAEMGGGEWRLSQGGSVQRRANDRGNGDFPLHATGSHGPVAVQ